MRERGKESRDSLKTMTYYRSLSCEKDQTKHHLLKNRERKRERERETTSRCSHFVKAFSITSLIRERSKKELLKICVRENTRERERRRRRRREGERMIKGVQV